MYIFLVVFAIQVDFLADCNFLSQNSFRRLYDSFKTPKSPTLDGRKHIQDSIIKHTSRTAITKLFT
jgi:hypothetical protein